jgi:hypothetical protein
MKKNRGLPKLSKDVLREMARRRDSTEGYIQRKYSLADPDNPKHLKFLKECLALEVLYTKSRGKRAKDQLGNLVAQIVKERDYTFDEPQDKSEQTNAGY